MKNKKIWIIIVIILFLVITFFAYNKFLGKIAIMNVKSYIKSNNIVVDDYKFVRLTNKFLFGSCQQGSGVLITNKNGNYEYEDIIKCKQYSSNNLNVLFLNYDEEIIDSDSDEGTNIVNSDDMKIIEYKW